ncbi:MAG: hypothetical protein ACI9JK_001340 [Phycisphaerales bacterium]|jgi:hypothetical protein
MYDFDIPFENVKTSGVRNSSYLHKQSTTQITSEVPSVYTSEVSSEVYTEGIKFRGFRASWL